MRLNKYYKKQYRVGEKIYYLDRFSPHCSKIKESKIWNIIKDSKEVIINTYIRDLVSMELIAPLNKKGLLFLKQKRNRFLNQYIINKEKEISKLKSKLKRWKMKDG